MVYFSWHIWILMWPTARLLGNYPYSLSYTSVMGMIITHESTNVCACDVRAGKRVCDVQQTWGSHSSSDQMANWPNNLFVYMTITLLGKLLLNCCYCILGQHLSCMVGQDPALLFLVIAPLHISVHNKQSQLEHSNKVQARFQARFDVHKWVNLLSVHD